MLKKIVRLIGEGVPYAYRYGGEEFCAVFYGHDRAGVMETMERLRRTIARTSFADEGLDHPVTVSSWVAEFVVTMNVVLDANDHADKAPYISKEDGRNRCTYYDDMKDRYLTDVQRCASAISYWKKSWHICVRNSPESKKESRGLPWARPFDPGAS